MPVLTKCYATSICPSRCQMQASFPGVPPPHPHCQMQPPFLGVPHKPLLSDAGLLSWVTPPPHRHCQMQASFPLWPTPCVTNLDPYMPVSFTLSLPLYIPHIVNLHDLIAPMC